MTLMLNNERFEILYSGFIVGGHLAQTKGLSILKKELKILEGFEKASVLQEGNIPGTSEPQRKWNGQSMELAQDEVNLLQKYVESVPWTTGKSVRNAVATLEYLDSVSSTSDEK